MDGAEQLRGGPATAVRDPRLLEEFHRRHVDTVLRFVARRVDDPNTAADLTAGIFLAVLDSADSYRPRLGSETAWLYGNRAQRRVVGAPPGRRVAREAERDLRFCGRRLPEADDIVRIEDKIDAKSPGRRALAALARLPEGERAVLELIAVDQPTVTEAAAALGIRQVTARVRLHRARKALREEADVKAAEPDPAATVTAVPVRRTRGAARSGCPSWCPGPAPDQPTLS
ncbi:RNA polymerase sigma factor [Streptomyces resistomycificus]|uniref:RNA polymerase sigma factor n=1 Tax=Streptomyces resistomycificus TaxID=67356 RepID=A0A0L8KZG6_9ACTN|nr:sigma-70 family RNA polymerase sigma factor [Streptomyces resistomycificus]KOG31204.1 RNA polymerase sigma factor [Streptomyces resistomycificus]KUO02336.1 RNA polymerase subunit sigma [Streptomyces resistomycificus]